MLTLYTVPVQGHEELGLTDRNSVGFLIWDRGTERTRAHGLGSRLGFSNLDIFGKDLLR